MQRPENGAHRVGNHQANETDNPTSRYAGRSQQRRGEINHSPQPIYFRSKMVGRFVSQRHQIEGPGVIEEQRYGDQA